MRTLGPSKQRAWPLNLALNGIMNIEKAHTSYRNAVFVFYLWLGSFVVPAVFPLSLPVTDSVRGTTLILTPSVLLGVYYAPRIIRSGVKSDVAVFIVIPVILFVMGAGLRAISI